VDYIDINYTHMSNCSNYVYRNLENTNIAVFLYLNINKKKEKNFFKNWLW